MSYTYYLYLPAVRSVEIYNAELTFAHRRNEKFAGIIDSKLEGSFVLLGADFDDAVELFVDQGYIVGDIYLDGNPLISFYASDFCDLDHKQKKGTIKNFQEFNPNSIRYYGEKQFTIPQTGSQLIWELGVTMTNYAHFILDIISDAFTNLNIAEGFDDTDHWFSPGIAINFADLKIANLRDCLNFDGSAMIGGQRKQMTLNKLLGALCSIFNVTIGIDDDGYVKFRKPSDLLANSLDLSAYLANTKIRNYDLTKLLQIERLDFSDNNYIGDGPDYMNCFLEYIFSGETLSHQLNEFSTKYTRDEDISGDGWIIVETTDSSGHSYAKTATGYVSSSTIINGNLATANLMNAFYMDYLYTDKKGFQICGNISANAPTYYKNFIEIPEINTTIADPSVFYDTIILETIDATQRVGLVLEQKTNLQTNQTTFICFEFFNGIDNG